LTGVNAAPPQWGDPDKKENHMRHRSLVFAAVAGFSLFSLPGFATEAPANGTPATGLMTELGAADFQTYCAACHGVSGKGDGTVAEFLTIPAADLTQLTKRNSGTFPKERLTEVIDGRADVRVHGPRDMPVWGDWFETEAAAEDMGKEEREAVVSARINALLAFIETIQE
jgi:mono/diheme cytochrome c family protein